MEETNFRLQHLEDKWSQMEQQSFQLSQRVDSIQAVTTQIPPLQLEVLQLKQQVENLENRNRRNNLRIYGLVEGI